MRKQRTMFAETRAYLERVGLPTGDYDSHKIASNEFIAGGHYGIEISSMNNFDILNKALELAKKYKVKVSRVIECRGIVRLPDIEIREMVKLCVAEKIGLIMSVGPRAISSIGGFVNSPNGKRLGYRLRGMENMVHAIEDIKRGIALGVRGFLIYDEGMLYLLNQMRKDEMFPKETVFKYSVHAGCANPLSAKLLEDNGADCINIIPDLDVCMIRAFRQAITTPLDIFSDTAKAAGGFLRTYDVPDIIRYAAPVYIKCGPISQPEQNHLPTPVELEERIKQARNVVEHIQRYLPEAKIVDENEKTLAIPVCNTD
ncbi:MAG: peptidase [Gammaproteobacteria bacterium]|nr:peptidase [Gammaproteobacteria bacterium]